MKKVLIKSLMIAIMVAVMVFGIVNLSISAEAEETNIAAGTVGEGISWVIGADGVLTISGSGEAFDFSWYSPPWIEYADQITSVKIEEGITQIPDTLLCSLNYATKIYIPSTVSYIGTIAFDNSFGIEEYVVAADNESYKSVIIALFKGEISKIFDSDRLDYKTMLQQFAEQEGTAILEYRTVSEDGPEHDKSFTVCAYINNNEVGRATAGTKKAAEMRCARIALELFGVI